MAWCAELFGEAAVAESVNDHEALVFQCVQIFPIGGVWPAPEFQLNAKGVGNGNNPDVGLKSRHSSWAQINVEFAGFELVMDSWGRRRDKCVAYFQLIEQVGNKVDEIPLGSACAACVGKRREFRIGNTQRSVDRQLGLGLGYADFASSPAVKRRVHRSGKARKIDCMGQSLFGLTGADGIHVRSIV